MSNKSQQRFKNIVWPWMLFLALLALAFSLSASKRAAATSVLPTGPFVLITKTRLTPALVQPGAPATFVIEVANLGNVDLPIVRLRDHFNDGCLILTNATPTYSSVSATIGNGEAVWNNIGPLAMGQQKVITTTFTTQIATDAQDRPVNCVNTTNLALVEALSDPNTLLMRNTASAVVSVSDGQPQPTGAALTVTKTRTSAASTVTPGTPVTFVIDVANTGTVALPIVRVRDHFSDACLLLANASPAYDEIWGTIGNSEATWHNIGPLAVGQHKQITTTFNTAIASDAQGRPFNCENTFNQAIAEALSAPNVVIAHADAEATVSVKAAANGAPALRITKTRTSPASVVTPGSPVSFRIDVVNSGGVDLPIVELRDNYNSGCLLFNISAPPYDLLMDSSDNHAAVIWDNIGPLAVGQHKTFHATFHSRIANDPQGHPLNCDNTVNEAIVKGLSSANTVLIQASASAAVSVRPAPTGAAALQVTKMRTSPAAVIAPGTPVTFTIDIANTGGVDLPVVRVVDHFNDGCMLFARASLPPDSQFGTIGTAEVAWNNVGPLAVGQHKVITTVFNAWISMDNSFPSRPFNCAPTVNEVRVEGRLGDIVVAQGRASDHISISNGQIITLFVAPYRKLCVGGFMAPFPCLQTRTTPTEQWGNFYEPIAGFTAQLGTEYELRVLREEIPNPPADASAYRYTLLEIVHASAVDLQDSDGDGMIDGAEAYGPNQGDGNNDGTPDYQQTNVATGLDATDSSFVTVAATGSCSTVENLLTGPQDGSGLTDANYHQPFGSVRFDLVCPQPGQSATVSFYWHGARDISNLRLRKYGPTVPGDPNSTAWYDFPATFSIEEIPTLNSNGLVTTKPVVKVTITLTDGQLGDSTGVDGRIVDPGAIAIGSPDVQLRKTLNTTGVVHPGQPLSFTIAITNTSAQVITSLPLTDTYDSNYLSFDSVVGAQPATDNNADDGQLNWSNVLAGTGGLAPGARRNIVVYFSAKLETTSSTGCAGALGTTCNVASLDAGISGVAVSPLEVTITATPGKSSVGDFVWHDWDGDNQQEPGEPGINGVLVNLYEDLNSNNQIDSGEFITSTRTITNSGIGGYYKFATVQGNRAYLVAIDASNFASGGPLAGFVFSNDKNTTPTSSSERQQFFLLGNPEDKTDVDFGLYCKFDLALTKTLAVGQSSTIQPGANVTFTLAVFNQGVVTATNISLVDYLPSGFTLSATGNSGWTSNGVTATLTLPGVVAPTGTHLVNIVLTASANLSGTYTNTAEISAGTAPGNMPLPDADSTPDRSKNNGSNGNTGESTGLVDNQVTGNGKVAGQDEDDHDIAPITVAPLTASYVISKKLVGTNPVNLYRPVTFTIGITNTGNLTIAVLPLRDLYQTTYLTYESATPPATDLVNDGQIDWSDLTVSFGRDLAPGQAFHVLVRFMALRDTTPLPGGVTVNTAIAHDATTTTTPIPDPQPVTATVRILAPTAVALAGHGAAYANGQVQLHWQTASEVEAASFNVLRQVVGAEASAAEWVKLNSQPITAQNPGQATGASYSYQDTTATPGQTYRYLLEIVDSSGQSAYSELGVVATGSRIYLSVIER